MEIVEDAKGVMYLNFYAYGITGTCSNISFINHFSYYV